MMNGFSKLSDIASFYRPSNSTAAPSDTSSPSLIVLCAWLSASYKHIAKYTDGYRRLFPNASILLIEARLPNMILGSDLTAVGEFLDSYLNDASSDSSNNEPFVVLHAFSNGGANNTTWLAERLLEQNSRLLFYSVIFDSCPGQAELASATRAITLSLPNQYLLRTVGWYFVYALVFVYKVIIEAMGAENTIARIRRVLNDPTIFSLATSRLYVYSEGDVLVDWRDVHNHAEDARKKGFTAIHEEKFSKAPHCALLNEDSSRYWDAVRAHILKSR